MFDILKDKWYLKVLLIGVVIRLLLMPITLHPDLWGHSFTAYFFAYEGRLNIYQHLLNLAKDHPLLTTFSVNDIFIYPPLAYFTLGFFRLLIRPFTDAGFIPFVMGHMDQLYSRADLFWNLFLYKLPYLFIDIFTAVVISNLFSDVKRKKQAFALWMFNPVTIYATFMIGQLDLLPVVFTVLSLYFAKREKYFWSLVCMGIGGSYKMYPLLFVFPAAFILAKQLKKRIQLVIAGFVPFILITLPFVGSAAYRQMVLFAPKSQKMLFMSLPLSGAEVVYPFVLLLVLIYAFAFYTKRRLNLNTIYLDICLLILSVTHYHPQWFLWVTPFLIIEMVESKFFHWLMVTVLFACWFLIMLMFDQTLNIGLFNPLNPALSYLKPLSEYLAFYTDVNQIKSLIRSVFAGISLFYIFDLFNNKNNYAE